MRELWENGRLFFYFPCPLPADRLLGAFAVLFYSATAAAKPKTKKYKKAPYAERLKGLTNKGKGRMVAKANREKAAAKAAEAAAKAAAAEAAEAAAEAAAEEAPAEE